MTQVVLVVAALTVVGLLVALAGRSSSAYVQKLLANTRTFLTGVSIDTKSQEARGKLRGLHVTCRLAMRGAGSAAEAWTEVEVAVDTRGICLEIRPQTAYEKGLRDQGLAVDLVLGDEAFDRAFIVEAAPADVVKELLVDDVRERLMKLSPVEVTFSAEKVQLARKAWHEEAGPMAELAEAAVAVAQRIPAAVEVANRNLAPMGQTPYRGVDALARRRAREQLEKSRKAEVERVLHVKAQREKHSRAGAIGLLVLILGCVVLVIAAQSCS